MDPNETPDMTVVELPVTNTWTRNRLALIALGAAAGTIVLIAAARHSMNVVDAVTDVTE